LCFARLISTEYLWVITPSTRRGRGKSRQNKASNRGDYAGKQHFVDSNTSSGTALRVRVKDDMTRAPVARSIIGLRMPVSQQTQIHWFQTSYQPAATLNASNLLTEFNQSFSLGQTGLVTPIAALFDQYAIFAVYVRVIINVSSNASSTASLEYVTAIDFDNINPVGNFGNLQTYSTSTTTELSAVQERYIEPCNAPALYSGSAFSHFGQDRMWVDAANVSTPHYGFRCIVAPIGAGATGSITLEITTVICARNVI